MGRTEVLISGVKYSWVKRSEMEWRS